MNTLSYAGAGFLILSGPAFAGEPATDKHNEAAAQDAPKADGKDIRVFWKDGFRFETADKSFTAKIASRVQLDTAFFSANETDLGIDLNDSAEFRRIYLGIWGLLNRFDYALEFNFVKGDATLTDVFLAHPVGALGKLTVGHFKEPQGLEELTSDLHTTFMERGLAAFNPVRNVGFMFSGSAMEERFGWAVGAFRANTDAFGSDTNTSERDYSATGRLTYLPWYEDGGENLAHVGVSYSFRKTADDTVSFSAKPESNLTTAFASSGAIAAEDYGQLGLEAALNVGRLSFQAEYMQAMVDGTAAGTGMEDPDLTGWYAYVSYFLAGGCHRNYKLGKACYDRVKPADSFGSAGGLGAFEVALRYTSIDFSDATDGQELDDVTFGLSWYLSANMKVMANVVHADREASDETADIFALRIQYDV